MTNVFDEKKCILGEAPLWHPIRNELFWVDLFGKRIHSKNRTWDFERYVSALGWVDRDRLFVASETDFFTFDVNTGEQKSVAPLEQDILDNRSNDGRADPWGGFWVGTMSKTNDPNAGSIYRYYRGEVRKLYTGITIPNSICFDPAGTFAYFGDTDAQWIKRVQLNKADGWPAKDPEIFLDFSEEDINPDGSVFDVEGRLWNAQWGASRVACYKDSKLVDEIKIPASQATCPGFGGPDGTTLFITSASFETEEHDAGKTFSFDVEVAGQKEPQVLL